MIRKKRFGLTEQEKVERQARRNNLIQQKEKILLQEMNVLVIFVS